MITLLSPIITKLSLFEKNWHLSVGKVSGIAISELPSPLRLCFKTRPRANLSNETECDLHETKPEGGTDFHMNGFAMTRFDTEAKANSEMACSESSAVLLADLYFDSFSYHVAPVVSSAGGIV